MIGIVRLFDCLFPLHFCFQMCMPLLILESFLWNQFVIDLLFIQELWSFDCILNDQYQIKASIIHQSHVNQLMYFEFYDIWYQQFWVVIFLSKFYKMNAGLLGLHFLSINFLSFVSKDCARYFIRSIVIALSESFPLFLLQALQAPTLRLYLSWMMYCFYFRI